VDVAPTIAQVLRLDMNNVDGRPIPEIAGWGCKKVVLLIVDSLGYDLYMMLEPYLPNFRSLALNGLLYKADCVSMHTTPAIASILSGLYPENHRVNETEDAYRSDFHSVLELAQFMNIRSAVVMEEAGARTFENKIEIIMGVPKRLSALKYDSEICARSLEAIDLLSEFLVAHFLGIDKITHLGLGLDDLRVAAIAIDDHIGEIARATSHGTLIIVCGDHPVHSGELKNMNLSDTVALILTCSK
jgi:hypothetical protein